MGDISSVGKSAKPVFGIQETRELFQSSLLCQTLRVLGRSDAPLTTAAAPEAAGHFHGRGPPPVAQPVRLGRDGETDWGTDARVSRLHPSFFAPFL
jgi:hypothetical protein